MIIRLLNTSGVESGNDSVPIAILTNIISWAVNESGASNANRICWPLKDTKFSLMNISPSKWLYLIKLFELSISAKNASSELNLSYETTLKGFNLLRQVIAEELAKYDEILKGEIEADESYFGGKRKGKRGRGAGHKTIVFGILERGEKVSVNIIQDVKAESLMTETVKRVRRGSIVYTDRWRGYDSLMFCGFRHLSIDHSFKFKQGKVYSMV